MDLLRTVPWILLGGVLFLVLSYIANKYHKKERKLLEFVQDFIGGVIFVSLLSAIVPDIFPDITTVLFGSVGTNFVDTISSATSAVQSAVQKSISTSKNTISSLTSVGSTISDDCDLQVGPIPGMRH